MPLTATQQIEIQNGNAIQSLTYPLDEIIYQIALNSGVAFQDSDKDSSASPDAQSYENKIKSVIKLVNRKDRLVGSQLTKMTIAILAKQAFTYEQVTGATEDQILNFFSNIMVEVFEKLAVVSPEEKAAYNSI